MRFANDVAFKEWAAVCAALEEGWQTLILRKGGIHEGSSGFQVEHDEFWLLPTYLHQKPESLVDRAHPLIERVVREEWAADYCNIRLYAVVKEVFWVANETLALDLKGHHAWSQSAVSERFSYRRPGLFALVVRIYRAPEAYQLLMTERIAGCRSWVDLPEEVSTIGAEPVVSDEHFHRMHESIRKILGPGHEPGFGSDEPTL